MCIHSFYRLKSGFSSLRTAVVEYILYWSDCMRTSADVFHRRPKNLDQRKSCILWRYQTLMGIGLLIIK